MERNRSFWSGLSGILTGIAGILAAAGTIVGLMHSHSDSSHAAASVQNTNSAATTQAWGGQANAICALAIKNGSGFIPSDPFDSQLPAAAQAADNWQSVDNQLRKLPADGQEQSAVSNMLNYWDQAIMQMRAAIQAAQNGDSATEQQDLSDLNTLNTQGNSLANELGAGTCASGNF